MTRTKKPVQTLKVPCDILNRILILRKLTEKELEVVHKKLRKLVSNSKPGNTSVIQYIKIVIAHLLVEEEQKSVSKVLDVFSIEKPTELVLIQNILASIYNAITDVYPSVRIEYICSDVNGIPPMAGLDIDEEFNKFLMKETEPKTKKKKATGKNASFSTIKEIEEFKKHLKTHVIGQDQAIDVVCDAIKLKAVNFIKTVNLFFVGKTGRGKTELARLVGERYSGNFWVINCAEFSNGHEVNRLLGAPPGYVGHSDKSIIKEKAEKSNKWVIVFDEIEKAHDKFYNFLLALMETGQCYDNIGTKIDFSDSIFIFTSNCGLKDLKKSFIGINQKSSYNSDREELMKALEKEFSPEFRNRIDEFVFFNDLSREDNKKIAELRLKEYPVKNTPELVDYVVDNGFSDEFGARGLGRFIRKSVALPLADAILDSKVPHDGTTKFDAIVNNGTVEIVNTTHLTASK